MALPLLGPFLISLVAPVVSRVLVSLGVGLVTYTGFSTALDLVKDQLQNAVNSLPADAMALVMMSGAPQALAIILSALLMKVTLTKMSSFQILSK